jgi:hypothetical protein
MRRLWIACQGIAFAGILTTVGAHVVAAAANPISPAPNARRVMSISGPLVFMAEVPLKTHLGEKCPNWLTRVRGCLLALVGPVRDDLNNVCHEPVEMLPIPGPAGGTGIV